MTVHDYNLPSSRPERYPPRLDAIVLPTPRRIPLVPIGPRPHRTTRRNNTKDTPATRANRNRSISILPLQLTAHRGTIPQRWSSRPHAAREARTSSITKQTGAASAAPAFTLSRAKSGIDQPPLPLVFDMLSDADAGLAVDVGLGTRAISTRYVLPFASRVVYFTSVPGFIE